MNTLYKHLEADLTLGLKAWRRSRWQRGIAISLLGLLGGGGMIFLAMPAMVTFPALWWFVLGAAAVGWVILTVQYLILPLRHRPHLTQIARYLEEQNPDLEDRLVTAVEFGRQAPEPPFRRRTVDPGEAPPDPYALLRRLMQDAISRTTPIDFSRQLQLRFAAAWRALSGVATVLALVAFFGYSGMFRQKLQQFLTTAQNVPKALHDLTITPGDARVRRGETVDVVAQSTEAVGKASIYIVAGKAASSARRETGDWSPNEMESTTQPGKFSYRLFDVRDTLRYYVRVDNEFSPIYTIIPLDAPEIKTLKLTYHFPAAMGLPAKQEAGAGDVYAPAGTRVDLSLVASQPLARAEWQLGENAAQSMRVIADTLAYFSFAVDQEGSYVIRLANAEGLANVSPEYYIHVTPDEAPRITITRPGRDARPTMLEETPLAAEVRDDFGLKQFDLVYSINDQPPVRQDMLANAARDSKRLNSQLEYRGETLLFLENLNVQPGDFISYYFEAGDAKQKANTDLYFLEVRPFEEEFYRALSQSGGGGNSPGLAVSQKEIITATWKLERARQTLPRDEVQQSSKAIAETQADLRESVANIAQRARLGGGLTEEMGAGKIIQYLEQAVAAMGEAVPPLEDAKLAEALDPERRAYQLLLKVDAERRRRELAMGGSASGYGQLQSSEELTRLFEDELNKIQSKYETLQNQQQQQQSTQLNEALQKVKELAQRQERLNELSRLMQRENQPPEEKKRQIERLRRQQDELNRDAQNLARQLHQLGQSPQGNQQSLQPLEENLRQAADDMTRTTDNLRRDNLANAGAEGNRALDRLRRLEEQLQQRRSDSLHDNLRQLREELQQLAESQNQLSDDLQRQGNSAPAAGAEQRRQWQERQQELQRRANNAREDLQNAQQAARRAAGEESLPGQEKSAREKQELSQELRKLAEEFDQRHIVERMEQAGEAIQQERLSEAERAQRDAAQNLQNLEQQLGESLSQLAEAPEEKLDLALQETQRFRRELEENLRQRSEANPAGQPGGQQNPNSQFAPNGAPSGDNRSNENLRPEEMNWWSERAWQGIRNLEKLDPFLRADTALADDYARLLQNYRGVVRTFRGGNALKREQIEKQLIDPLRRFEAELATRLAVLQHQQNILTVRDEPVPPQYREMVDKYFERLSKKR